MDSVRNMAGWATRSRCSSGVSYRNAGPNTVAESDVSIETIALFNCRELLEVSLSVCHEEQVVEIVQRRIITMT